MNDTLRDNRDLVVENQTLREKIEKMEMQLATISHLPGLLSYRKRITEIFRKINDYFLKLGPSFPENIQLLTSLCGELTGADFAVYHHAEGERLLAAGRWNTPPDLDYGTTARKTVAADSMRLGADQVAAFTNLPDSLYVGSDPNLLRYDIRTCLAKAVFSNGEAAGSICCYFTGNRQLNLEDEQILTITASALGNEVSRNSALKKLRESEERFHSAFQTSPDSVNINRLSDGLYVNINEGFSKLTGYSQEDVAGKTSLEINIWENPADRALLVEELMGKGFVENLEATFRLKDGTTRTGLMSARVFHIQGVPHILSVTRDMTELKEAMSTILESEQKFRSVVENAFDGIYLISETRFSYVNHRFCEIMGRTAEEMTADDFDFNTTLPDSSRQLIEQRRQARLLGQEVPGIYEFAIITKSGKTRIVEVSTVSLQFKEKLTVLGIMRDITERKKLIGELVEARDKAEEINVLKSRLLANLSHEIRTPLNGILGFAELLREEIPDPAQKSMADIIYTSGHRLLDTLNSILDLSVIESGSGKIRNMPVNLNRVARQVADRFQPATDKKGIRIQFVEYPDEIVTLADEELINKILYNLVGNAVKFTEKGTITLNLSIEGTVGSGFASIHVADTGIGIHPEHHDLIFDEFRQVSEGHARWYEGAGLGLYISRRFAEMMGGTVRVTSQPFEGSTFTLRLPLS
jgi:PAS domain S-box-containing protein